MRKPNCWLAIAERLEMALAYRGGRGVCGRARVWPAGLGGQL